MSNDTVISLAAPRRVSEKPGEANPWTMRHSRAMRRRTTAAIQRVWARGRREGGAAYSSYQRIPARSIRPCSALSSFAASRRVASRFRSRAFPRR